MIASRIGICICKRVCANGVCKSSKHINGLIQWNHKSFFVFFTYQQMSTSPFCQWFQSKDKCDLDQEAFIFVLACSLCFSSNDPLGMVYEFLCKIFLSHMTLWVPLILFEVCGHIAYGHVPPFVLCLLAALQLLVL